MQPQEALQNIKAVTNAALGKGVLSDLDSAVIVGQSIAVIESLVNEATAAKEASAAGQVSAKELPSAPKKRATE